MSSIAATFQNGQLYHLGTDGTTRTKIYNLKSTPEFGLTSPAQIDSTDLEDIIKTYEPGTSDPGTLDFVFNAMPKGATNSNVDLVSTFANPGADAQTFYLWLPRMNMEVTLVGKATYSIGAGAVDSITEMTMHLMLSAPVIIDTLGGSWTVTYDANGGTGTLVDANSPYSSGESVTVVENTLTYTGHSFLRFNTKADGTGINYESGDIFNIYSNTVLYAIWKVTT